MNDFRRNKMKNTITILVLMCVNCNIFAQTPIDTDFTYQGELIFNNQLVTGDYDFEVTAFDAITNGTDYDAPFSVDAISVVNGVFTLPLDFGDAPFMGNEVFLEIGVRLNGSGLPYEKLNPRQKLTSSPYAIHAQFVGADSVTSNEILDGTITTPDLANNAITSDKINASAVGVGQINSTQVQRRVSGNCVAGQFISAVNEDGSVNCNVDNTGSTTVTSADIVDGTIASVDLSNSIITSSKIALNSITSSRIVDNTITSNDIAGNAVGSSELIDGSVGENKIDSSQVQKRVSNTCDLHFYMSGINEDGTVQCRLLRNDYYGVKFDTTSFLINSLSTHVGSDNLPVTSYYDAGTQDLKMVKCTTPNCNSFNPPITLDSTGIVGRYSDLAIGSDGNPIISYRDTTNTSLKIVTWLCT